MMQFFGLPVKGFIKLKARNNNLLKDIFKINDNLFFTIFIENLLLIIDKHNQYLFYLLNLPL